MTQTRESKKFIQVGTNQWDNLVFRLFRDERDWEYREPGEEVAECDRGHV